MCLGIEVSYAQEGKGPAAELVTDRIVDEENQVVISLVLECKRAVTLIIPYGEILN